VQRVNRLDHVSGWRRHLRWQPCLAPTVDEVLRSRDPQARVLQVE